MNMLMGLLGGMAGQSGKSGADAVPGAGDAAGSGEAQKGMFADMAEQFSSKEGLSALNQSSKDAQDRTRKQLGQFW